MTNPDPILPSYNERTREWFSLAFMAAHSLGYNRNREAYLAWIAPDAAEHDPMLEDEMGHMWSCALAVMGGWRAAGVKHPLLISRYLIGLAISWCVQIGRDNNALIIAGTRNTRNAKGDLTYPDRPEGLMFPMKGDSYFIKGYYHTQTVVTDVRSISDVFGVISGGHVAAEWKEGKPVGGMCIDFVAANKFSLDSLGRILSNGAKIDAWIDCTKLGVKLPVADDINPPTIDPGTLEIETWTMPDAPPDAEPDDVA